MRIAIILAALAASSFSPAAARADGLLSLDREVAIAQGKQDAARDQDRAYDATKSGKSMPLPMIERRVVPQMGSAQYLGPEFRGSVYRLKFLSDGRVIWIDVDARTGRVMRRSGR